MPFQDRPKTLLDLFTCHNFIKRFFREVADDLFDKYRVFFPFQNLH